MDRVRPWFTTFKAAIVPTPVGTPGFHDGTGPNRLGRGTEE